MPRVTLDGVVLAESNHTIIVEGNHYFPPESLQMDYFSDSSTKTVCHWKGTASFYNVLVGDRLIEDAAWYYPEAKDAAKNIKNYVAFYKSKVQVQSGS